MTLLITGGTGFLGSYLTRYALREGAQERVVVLDLYPDRSRIADVLDRVDIIEGDVADAALLASIFHEHGIARIAHFAFILGSPSPGRMPDYVKVQCQGTANLLEAARMNGIKRFLFASSVAAYGEQSADTLTEDLIGNPKHPYGFCKLWAEALTRHYASEFDLDTVTLRFGSTYGLGRAWRGSYNSGLLRTPSGLHYMARVEDAVRGRPITLPDDDIVADWTYAGDAALAAWLTLSKDKLAHDLYNVGAERLPIGAFTAAMRRLLPNADIAVSVREQPGNPHAPMDTTRLVSDLGFVPRFNLDSGLADYIARIAIADRYNAAHL